MRVRVDLGFDLKRSLTALTRSAIALTMLCLAFTSGQSRAQSSEISVEVITHPSVNSEYLTRSFLRAAFTLRTRSWPDGEPVTIFVLRDTDTLHTAFSRQILGTFPYVLRRAWDRAVFTGTGLVPHSVQSIEEMRSRVLSTPGAVGYIPTLEQESMKNSDSLTAIKGEHS